MMDFLWGIGDLLVHAGLLLIFISALLFFLRGWAPSSSSKGLPWRESKSSSLPSSGKHKLTSGVRSSSGRR